MSRRDPAKYLYDMLSSCDFLIAFTTGKTLEQYKEDRAFRSAVERELQIIGEALMQLDRHYPNVAARIPRFRQYHSFSSHSRAWIRSPQPRHCVERHRNQTGSPESTVGGAFGRGIENAKYRQRWPRATTGFFA